VEDLEYIEAEHIIAKNTEPEEEPAEEADEE
jgi:ribosomal protein S24E